MESDNFCLKWNNFETNISTAFKEIREDKDFFDVTLACDDDQIQAHKVILSACSPFFKSILKRNRHEHPLLYLKGVKYTDLVAVLNFMYHGEVNVAQKELNTFLGVAEELKIKGLTQNCSNENSNIQTDSFNKKQETPHNLKAGPAPKKMKTFAAPQAVVTPTTKNTKVSYSYDGDDDIQEVLPVKTELVESLNSSVPILTPANQHQTGTANQNTALVENSDNSAIYGEDFGEFVDYNAGGEGYEQSVMQDTGDANKDEILDTMIESILVRRVHPLQGLAYECSVCNKVLKNKYKMQQHAEIHLKGFSHQCNFCGKHYKTRPSLKVHISTQHKEEKDNVGLESILG